MIRIHILVSGIVQGVNFRHYTATTANTLGLTGWVRNLSDSRVEVLCEGNKEYTDQLAEWCKKGPDRAYVKGIEIIREKYTGEFKTFDIRY
ncbi:MAG: acylphosphatase [Syntrophus sp. (in: bacteria)]|nr:acylphosphatase [Syntrophus sp. (in: bacteria)]